MQKEIAEYRRCTISQRFFIFAPDSANHTYPTSFFITVPRNRICRQPLGRRTPDKFGKPAGRTGKQPCRLTGNVPVMALLDMRHGKPAGRKIPAPAPVWHRQIEHLPRVRMRRMLKNAAPAPQCGNSCGKTSFIVTEIEPVRLHR
jgi:hypothetical protein